MKKQRRTFVAMYVCRTCGGIDGYSTKIGVEEDNSGYGLTSDMIANRLSAVANETKVHHCGGPIFGVMDVKYFKEIV